MVFEHLCNPMGVQGKLLGVWWNGKAGLAKRRIYLRQVGEGFEIEKVRGHEDPGEGEFCTVPLRLMADAVVQDAMAPEPDEPNNGWRETTHLYRQ